MVSSLAAKLKFRRRKVGPERGEPITWMGWLRIVMRGIGLVLALLFMVLQAPDVAFAELAVGTAAVPLLFLVIIASVGMSVRKSPARLKAPFSAKPGPVSGSVVLAAKAVALRASYEWEWSGDGGHTWTPVLPTLSAKSTVTGLPVATTCQFRFRSVTKDGVSDWSQVILLVIK